MLIAANQADALIDDLRKLGRITRHDISQVDQRASHRSVPTNCVMCSISNANSHECKGKSIRWMVNCAKLRA